MAETDTHPSSVHAILLAAGASKRFGKENKLLAKVGNAPLVQKTAKALLASRAAAVLAVTGFEASRVAEALSGLEIRRAYNADYEDGLASSIRCGIDSLPVDARGAMIALADMPGLTARLANRLIDAFEKAESEKIVYPVSEGGMQGNPVIWPRRFFPELLALEGDKGAKALLQDYNDACVTVSVKGDAAFKDIDKPSDLESGK